MEHLPLQVGNVHDVAVNDTERPHAGGSEVERRRGAEPARAHEQDPGVEQLPLALDADLGDEDVAAVALGLLTREPI